MYTIGHSTRPLEDLIGLLKAHSITMLVDVRTIPRSRKNPQFNIDTLPAELEKAGIKYLHLKGLGGLRKAKKDSVNMGWRNESFRGFADYMQTAEFDEGLKELIALARKERVAIMCAEAVPWRCHRSLIGDALLVRGIDVEEISGKARTNAHKLTPWAKAEGKKITYPGPSEEKE